MADLDVVVVGAGFAGIYAVHALRSAGLSVRAFEAGSGVGGTWFWNCYPGARSDVESKDYSYSFSPELEQDWSWSERYPAQPEVLSYLNYVADRFQLRPLIQLETRVTAAVWVADAAEWAVTAHDGATVTARFLVSAVGCLSAYQIPSLPGLATFAGPWYHTSRWPKEGVDFTGKRVGLVGTGSTGIQVAPELAAVAEHLTVFQRTANFAVPNRNAPIDASWERSFKASYREYRAQARGSALGVPIAGTGRAALDVASRCDVVSVEYRLAPEHVFPAAARDAFTAVAWAGSAAGLAAGRPLVVAGDSAGGNLAAVAALLARDAGGPPIALQLLVYPVADCDLDRLSYQQYAGTELILNRGDMVWFWDHYVPDSAARVDPDASPLRAADLTGLPPAYVITAEHDPLRDEGFAYAERLRGSRVPVEHRHYGSQIHGFFTFVNRLDDADKAIADAGAAIAAAVEAADRESGQ